MQAFSRLMGRPAGAKQRSNRIVIADDNPEDRAELRRRLLGSRSQSETLVETETGAATVRAILDVSAGPLACVLLDYTLPDMTAPEVLAAVAGPDGLPPCPIVVITGVTQTDMGRAVLRAGAHDYVGKDWLTEPVLIRAMENAAERWALSRDLHAKQTALRESEERYRRLVNVLPDAVFVHIGHKMVFCNPAFVQLVGAAEPAEVLGLNPLEVVHPDYHHLLLSQLAAMVTSGESGPALEMQVLRRDGTLVPVHAVSTPITGYGPSAYLVALSDLTERERSAGLLRAVLGSVEDAILTSDDRGKIRSANPATERLFGYAVSDLVGRDVTLLLPEVARESADRVTSRQQAEGRRKDGITFPVEVTVTAFLLGGERLFTGVIRDVTARRQLEDQLLQAQKMEAVGRLAGGVAHDFNNLLTVINGYTEVLLETLPSADTLRGPIAAIHDAGERATRLTRQLLAFSRKAIIQPRTLDFNAVVQETKKLLGRLIGEDIHLQVMTDESPAWVWADPGQLDQVIMNLVVNARDAMPTGGTLTIGVKNLNLGPTDLPGQHDLAPGRYVRLSVADTGLGIPEEVLVHIFEPFFTTKGVGKGTGLGLAVVHGVVKQCGGSIAVDTKSGGTTFDLLFPFNPPTTAKAAPAGKAETWPTPGQSVTVLLVEDEAAVRKVARMVLEVEGYTVLEAGGGTEALRLANEHTGAIDLLLTDVVMPDMGGRRLAEALRLRRPGLRVLFMSGHTDDALMNHGGVEGNFIPKPFGPLSLTRKVRSVLAAKA